MTFAPIHVTSLGSRSSLLVDRIPGCPQQPAEPVPYDIHFAMCSLQVPDLRDTLERGAGNHGAFTTPGKPLALACALMSWFSYSYTQV